MQFFNGPMAPGVQPFRALRASIDRGRVALVVICLSALPGLEAQSGPAAEVQSGPALTLAEAERLALDGEPGQAAFEARADALSEQAVAAGALPDPKLRVGLANYPIERGGFSTEPMTQGQIGFQQSFPPGQSRAVGTRRFASLAEEMSANADARSRDVRSGVRSAWLDAYYWDRAERIVTETRPFFADLVEITRSLYAVGTRDQQDVLRSELELSRLDDRLIEIGRQRAAARAALAQWLPGEASRPLADALPDWDRVPDLTALEASLDSHPAVQAADARVAAQEAGIDLAREHYKPGWTLDVGYGYRQGALADGTPRSDMVSVGVVVDMPFFRGNRQDRTLAAAFSERRAASEAREQLKRRLVSEVDAQYARFEQLTRRIELYDGQILNQTHETAQAALLAYQSEAGDFADVMRASIDELNTRLDYLHLRIERAQSYAVLANLGGLEP